MSDHWNVIKLLQWAQEDFKKQGMEQPRLEAEILLGHALGKSRVELYLAFENTVDAEDLNAFRELVVRRRKGVPSAYLTGAREFYSLTFKVNGSTLIPRPETEGLMDLVLERIGADEEVSLCDVGTGSGVLAITFAKQRPKSKVTAIDSCEEALEMARMNAEENDVEVHFRQGDLLNGVSEKFDVIVANLPYISESGFLSLEVGVRENEPKKALLGGKEGTELIFRLVEEARDRFQPHGQLFLEIGYDQANLVLGRLESLGYVGAERFKDLAGLDRYILATWPKA